MKTPFVLLAFVLASAAVASPRHYLYLFSYDDGEMSPDKTHTWAELVEVGGSSVSHFTISWLPKSGKIRTLVLGPERGRNNGLDESFAPAVAGGWGLAQWGPYEITDSMYRMAVDQKALLESGAIWYRVIDTQNRIFKVLEPLSVPLPRAVMCVHAVSDLVYPQDDRGFLLTARSSGFEGTAKVAWHLTPWYVRRSTNRYELEPVGAAVEARMSAALDLARYPTLQRRALTSQKIEYCETQSECRSKAAIVDLSIAP